MKLFHNQNVISACILGCQFELLEYLVKDTKKGAFVDDIGTTKYVIDNIKDEPYYWKSRANKDAAGNNSCHHVFKINYNNIRYKFLRLLIAE